jgi:drug/metabolite transporter (DMT)-like permease
MNSVAIIIIVLFCTISGAFGGYYFKKASTGGSLFCIVTSKKLFLELFLYILGSVLNIMVLKYLDYSVLLQLTSITYIWTLFISRMFLGEQITKYKIASILIILIGSYLISNFY